MTEERALVRSLGSAGFAAKKTFKVRAHGLRQFYEWLDEADLLIVRANGKEPLVILPMRLAAEAIGAKVGRPRAG
jgi:hypothetical protein